MPGRIWLPWHYRLSLYFNHKNECTSPRQACTQSQRHTWAWHAHTDTANTPNSLWLQWGRESESLGSPCDQTLTWAVYSLHVVMPEPPQEANTEHLEVCEHTVSVQLTVDLQHDGGLFSVTTGVGGLAAVDARILDDGVVNDESGSWRLCVERHALGGHNALTLRVVPLQPHWLADSWEQGQTERKREIKNICFVLLVKSESCTL